MPATDQPFATWAPHAEFGMGEGAGEHGRRGGSEGRGEHGGSEGGG